MALANQGFTLRHFPGRQADALQSLRRCRQLTDRNASDHMTKLVVFTINEIEAEMANKREGLPFDARVQHKMRGEACEVAQVASSWAGCDLCGGCGAAPTGRGKSHALCSGCPPPTRPPSLSVPPHFPPFTRTRCHLISFCSSECQAIAWQAGHKRACRGKQALPTPVQLRAAPPAVLAPLLTEYQAGNASLALVGVKCVLAILSSESQSEPISAADSIALQGCVTGIVRSHPHHAPIKKGGTLALFALARSAGGRRRMLGGLCTASLWLRACTGWHSAAPR